MDAKALIDWREFKLVYWWRGRHRDSLNIGIEAWMTRRGRDTDTPFKGVVFVVGLLLWSFQFWVEWPREDNLVSVESVLEKASRSMTDGR